LAPGATVTVTFARGLCKTGHRMAQIQLKVVMIDTHPDASVSRAKNGKESEREREGGEG
jgi:hypothetical protein